MTAGGEGVVVIMTEALVLPGGMDADDVNASAFGIRVWWRGSRNDRGTMGGYSIEHGGQQLTRARNWLWHPRPFQYRLCRLESFEEALQVAREVVNGVTVGGRTWTQVQQMRADRELEQAAQGSAGGGE